MTDGGHGYLGLNLALQFYFCNDTHGTYQMKTLLNVRNENYKYKPLEHISMVKIKRKMHDFYK